MQKHANFKCGQESNKSVVLAIPVYKEAKIVKETVKYFAELSRVTGGFVYFVTTQREAQVGDNTTHEKVKRYIKGHKNLKLVHYEGTGAKAAQVNYLIKKIAGSYDYIGIFDADSRPEAKGIEYVTCSKESPDVFQMPSRYDLNISGSSSFVLAMSVYQTRWSLGYEIPRWLHWAKSIDQFNSAMYVVGHGLFLSSHIDKLPENTLTEDIALGYKLSREGAKMQLVPYFDHSSVPAGIASLTMQSSRWFYGELVLCKEALMSLFRSDLPAIYRIGLVLRSVHVSMWAVGAPVFFFAIAIGIANLQPWLLALSFLSFLTYVYIAHLPAAKLMDLSVYRLVVSLPVRCLVNFIGPWVSLVQITLDELHIKPMEYYKTKR